MNINESKLLTLWYENDSGDKLEVNFDEVAPDDFIYQYSQFPCELTTRCLKLVRESEVDNCTHSKTRETFGWISGIEGRECLLCYGSQTKRTHVPWPEKWDAYGSKQIFSGSASYPKDLAVALVRQSLKQFIKSLFRNRFKILKKYSLDKAILIAAQSCERCLNALLYTYGIDEGYPELSEEWYRARTSCLFCEHMPKEKNTIENRMKNLLK